MKNKRLKFRSILVTILVVIGIFASISFYSREPGNPKLNQFPLVTTLHIVLGIIYLSLAPFQLLGSVRKWSIAYHTWIGRALVVIGIIIGLTATFMTLIVPFSGWSERLIVTPFAILFSIAIVNGYRFARLKKFMLHKFWMMRAFSIGLAISTTRLIFIPALIVLIKFGNPINENIALLSTISFTLAFIIHIIVVEKWIIQEKKKL